MSVLIVIPARCPSVRYPGKPLVPLTGASGVKRSLIERSWLAATSVGGVDRVVVATDDDRIRTAAEAFGAEVVMTSDTCVNGTERCAEAARKRSVCPITQAVMPTFSSTQYCRMPVSAPSGTHSRPVRLSTRLAMPPEAGHSFVAEAARITTPEFDDGQLRISMELSDLDAELAAGLRDPAVLPDTLAADLESLQLARATLTASTESVDLIRQSRDVGLTSDLVVTDKYTDDDVESARREAISYAALRLLQYRFPGVGIDPDGAPCQPALIVPDSSPRSTCSL